MDEAANDEMSRFRVLIVDDRESERYIMRSILDREGYDVVEAGDGPGALEELASGPVDLVVLDVAMPGMDGLTLCQEIRRRSGVPVVFCSARGDALDRVVGLEMGADDYVAKPYHPRELVARVRARLRRCGGVPAGRPEVRMGRLSLDLASRQARWGSAEVALTVSETLLLKLLMEGGDRTRTRSEILRRVWGDTLVSKRTVDSHIRNLRIKLRRLAPHSVRLETVRGVGYRLSAREGSAHAGP